MNKNSYNKVILIGRLGADPDGRYTKNGRSTVAFSLATNETCLNAENETFNNTVWHNILTWNKLAEFANEYLFKGQSIYLEGKIHTSSWSDKEGNQRTKSEIICSNIVPLEWKSDDKREENHK